MPNSEHLFMSREWNKNLYVMPSAKKVGHDHVNCHISKHSVTDYM